MKSLSIRQVSNQAEELNINHIFGYEWLERKFGLVAYFDSRTRFDGFKAIVKPMGKAGDNYFICCPHCHRFEAVHKAEITEGEMIKSKCTKGGYKPSRIFVRYSKRARKIYTDKVKQVGYCIDLEGWCD